MEEDFKNDFVDTLMLELFDIPAPPLAELVDEIGRRGEITSLSKDVFYELLREGRRIKKEIL
ncbi:MAG: hypothetical protein E7050_06070 [Lentisphaerae bacterium]|nr:hypothetical protein [Lentisphaerota bacterium]